MANNLNAPKSSIRQRRTGNLTQSYPVQMKQFFVNCRQRNLTQNSIATYERHLGKFDRYLSQSGHSTLIPDIDRTVIEEYLLMIREVERLKPETVNSVIRHLKAFFSYLQEHNVMETNPMAKIKKLKIDEEPLLPFTERQITILLSQPDKSTYVGYRDFIMMNLLLGTGMRVSELVNIKFSDIDLQEGSILIRLAKARKPRIVGIPKTLKPELKRFFHLCYEKISEQDFVFQNIDGNQITVRTVQEQVSQYGKSAGISGVRCSPHSFRRTYAINYLKNGGCTASLRQQLGHSSLQIVEKYLYWSERDVLAEQEKYNISTI